jgi:hypothetical protein
MELIETPHIRYSESKIPQQNTGYPEFTPELIETYKLKADLTPETEAALDILLMYTKQTRKRIQEQGLDLLGFFSEFPETLMEDEALVEQLFDYAKRHEFAIWSPFGHPYPPKDNPQVSLMSGYFGQVDPEQYYFKTWLINCYQDLKYFRTGAIYVYTHPEIRRFDYKKLLSVIREEARYDPYMRKYYKILCQLSDRDDEERIVILRKIVEEIHIENKKLVREMIKIVQQIVIEESIERFTVMPHTIDV